MNSFAQLIPRQSANHAYAELVPFESTIPKIRSMNISYYCPMLSVFYLHTGQQAI